jgi:hypothetical protein
MILYTYIRLKSLHNTKWIITVVINSYCFKMTEIVILFLILDLINWNLSSPPVSGGVRVARSWLSWSHQYQCFTVATMTWLTVMEYLCHRWPRICSTCRKHFPVLSSFMTYHELCNLINTTGLRSGAGTAYHSGAHEFIPRFLEGFV